MNCPYNFFLLNLAGIRFNFKQLTRLSMKRFSGILNILISVLMILLLVSCKECPTEPKPIDYNLQLSVRFQGCKSIKFNLSSADSTREKIWVLNRDGQFISSDTLYGSDTVITDNTVSVDNTYKYQALFYNKSDNFLDSSTTLEVVMLPSTSHEFTWELDTIGYSGDLWDVFAISENDVWVVGTFEIEEPDTVIGTEKTQCNAAHWDGEEWIKYQIPVDYRGYIWPDPLYSVYGFSADEVYFLSHTRLVLWNGSEFIQMTDFLDDPTMWAVNTLWARSSTDLYAGGVRGYMVATDGLTVNPVPKFTELGIREIVGDSYNKLWVTADNVTGDGEFHYFDGDQWQKMWDVDNLFYPFSGPLGYEYLQTDALFPIDDSYIVMMVGGNNAMVVIHSQDDFNDYDILFFLEKGWWRAIDGNGINDFFGVGNSTLATHFNGTSYQNYPEISIGSFWEGVDQIGDYAFIVGNPAGPVVAIGKR